MKQQDSITCAQLIVDALSERGVRYIFGIPGVHNIDLYDALTQHPEIKPIITRHEQGAAFMADGYARVSGEAGVVFVITGPGVTNAYTGIAEAYFDSSPVAVFATEIQKDFIGQERGFIHELPDQKGIVDDIVKWSVRITDPDEAKMVTKQALHYAVLDRQRPVYVEIPLNILPEKISSDFQEHPFNYAIEDTSQKCVIPSQDDLKKARRLLEQAQRPLIYVGGGIRNGEGSRALIALAEKIGAPIISTVKGKGAVPAGHPLYVGVSWAKEVMESDLLKESDVLLALGTRLSLRLKYGGYGEFQLPEKIIHVDIDSKVIGQNFSTTVGICADVVATMKALKEEVEVDGNVKAKGYQRAKESREIILQSLQEKAPVITKALSDIRQSLPKDAIIVGDNALIGIWSARYLPVYQPRTFLFPMGYGTLGFAVPAAIGAKLAKPVQPAVALVGDGGFLFSSQELAVAMENNIDLIVLLVNDRRYGSVHYNQRKRFGRVIATELQNPDFELFARSLNCRYQYVKNPDKIEEAIHIAMQDSGIQFIELNGNFIDWY